MKLSISLSAEELAALDEYRVGAGLPSRSAAVANAIRLLGRSAAERDYTEAWAEWESSGDAAAWDATAADGHFDAPR